MKERPKCDSDRRAKVELCKSEMSDEASSHSKRSAILLDTVKRKKPESRANALEDKIGRVRLHRFLNLACNTVEGLDWATARICSVAL